MTPEQFERLPEACKRIIVIDRAMALPVVAIGLARERREQRRLVEIMVRQPRSGGSGRAAA